MEGKIKRFSELWAELSWKGIFAWHFEILTKAGEGCCAGGGGSSEHRNGAGALALGLAAAMRYSHKQIHRACLREDLAARRSLTHARDPAINAPQAWRRKEGWGVGISPKLDQRFGKQRPPGGQCPLSLRDLLCDLEESTCCLCALPIINPFCSHLGGMRYWGVIREWKVLAQSQPAIQREALSSGLLTRGKEERRGHGGQKSPFQHHPRIIPRWPLEPPLPLRTFSVIIRHPLYIDNSVIQTKRLTELLLCAGLCDGHWGH